MSTFSGLSGALSSLYAQRRGMDVTGQNIANANTEGYSRQRIDMQAVGGSAVPAMYSVSDGTSGGVTVSAVARVQDTFLETRGRIEHAQNSYLADQNLVYTKVQQAFGALSTTGLQTQMSEMWSSWHDLANHPGDGATRAQVLARSATVADTLHMTHDALGSLFTTSREQLDAIATDINSTAAQVAQLNQAVVRGTQAGLPVNELADQRDRLVMHLTELTGATAQLRENGSLDVTLGGSGLVNGDVARQLTVGGARRLEDVAGAPVTLTWTDNNAQVIVPSGQVASSLEALNSIIPDYSARLDGVAKTLADTVNALHVGPPAGTAQAYDRSGAAGGAFFGAPSGATVTASNISVLITDPNKVAASGTTATGGTLDGTNADLIAGIGVSVGSPDKAFRNLVSNLGVAAQRADRRAAVQDTLTKDVDSSRQAQAGVNLDEEMTNLIAYQRAYQAASKVISTLDSTFDSLINMVRG
ncbi:flagellar hook-associated protein FlgK [Planosporangium mesophilum]|uniref:Flagellar hook-associated protein 1 n=1 Tax=Planosporangium mesophilum TaxID=689768 RepID=A0A8J3TCA9_9ACTN|nr:flagellar hook-associated protein FlgK [Planosporangium mesophilum]NJC85613.1 flagellar hook-associated protein FlgK [Planosporangium mesophilum]GII24520.1 flagellar hook-associated protein 1 [Planosporangium mesophilum]